MTKILRQSIAVLNNLWEQRQQPIVYSGVGLGCFLFLLIGFLFKDPTTFAELPEPASIKTIVLKEVGGKKIEGQEGLTYVHQVWAKYEMKVTQVAVSGGSAAEATVAGAETDMASEDGFESEAGFEAGFEEGFEDDGFDSAAVAVKNKGFAVKISSEPLAIEDGFGEEGFEGASESISEDGFVDEVDDAAESGIDLIAMVDAMKKLPAGLDALPPAPKVDADKVLLGQRLYFDKRLSGDGKSSCATCHAPDKGYSDGLKTSVGFAGKVLRRHSPTVLNAVYNKVQFWDGRVKTLADQAKGPLMADVEMNAGSPEQLAAAISSDAEYLSAFQTVYQNKPNLELIADAIAEFEATLVTPDSAFDRYAQGDKAALNDSQKRGLALFFGKARCTSCHTGVNFTDEKYHNLGLVNIHDKGADLGRYNVTKKDIDKGCFKTPTVRNAELTAPFMHDGSVATLMDLVVFYNKGGHEGPNKSELLKPLNLNKTEMEDLVAFMKSLTGKLPKISDPWEKTAKARTKLRLKKADVNKLKLSLNATN